MRPRIFSARAGLIFCVVILSIVSIDFTGRAVATQAGLLAYCASSPDQPDIYISQIFNTGLKPASSQGVCGRKIPRATYSQAVSQPIAGVGPGDKSM